MTLLLIDGVTFNRIVDVTINKLDVVTINKILMLLLLIE